MMNKLTFTSTSFEIPYEDYQKILIIKSIICHKGGAIKSAEIFCNKHYINENFPNQFIVKYFQDQLGLKENTVPTFIYGQKLINSVHINLELDDTKNLIIEVLITSESRPPFYGSEGYDLPIHNILLYEEREVEIKKSEIITTNPDIPDVIFIEEGDDVRILDYQEHGFIINTNSDIPKKIRIYGYLYYPYCDKRGYLSNLNMSIW